MSRSHRRAAVAALFSFLFGCSAFVSLDGLTGGDAGLAEGGDGSDDVESDVVVQNDAGIDGRVSPCLKPHTFCDDFDHGLLGAKWDRMVMTAGSLSLSTNAVTQPNALEATAISITGGSQTLLAKTFPAMDHTHIELDIQVANPSDTTQTEVDLVALWLVQAPPGYSSSELYVERWQDAAILEQYALADDGGSVGQSLPINETFNAWRHVTLDLDRPSSTFTMSIDGQTPTVMLLEAPLAMFPFELGVGVANVSSTIAGEWDVWIDNVVVDQN